LAGVGVPNAHGPVAAPRSQALAVGTVGHAPHGSPMVLAGADKETLLDVPEAQGAVQAGRGKLLSVRPKCQAKDLAGVPGEAMHLLARLEVPEADGAVPAAGCEAPAIGVEGHVPHRLGVAPEGAQVGVAEVPEVVPFPAAVFSRNFFQPALGALKVIDL